VSSNQTESAGRDLPYLQTLADRLEYLFDRVRPTVGELGSHEAVGRKYTTKEIAAKINDVAQRDGTGVTISAAYVGEMRRGVTTDPRTSHIQALARAFGVDPAFFVDSQVTRRVQEQIDLLNELRQMKVQQVALRRVLRQQGLSDDSARLIEQLVDRCRKLEGLDEDSRD
jgi:transcriptional regulator with XRE-family HTH domain